MSVRLPPVYEIISAHIPFDRFPSYSVCVRHLLKCVWQFRYAAILSIIKVTLHEAINGFFRVISFINRFIVEFDMEGFRQK
jgi:hypothetical protein